MSDDATATIPEAEAEQPEPTLTDDKPDQDAEPAEGNAKGHSDGDAPEGLASPEGGTADCSATHTDASQSADPEEPSASAKDSGDSHSSGDKEARPAAEPDAPSDAQEGKVTGLDSAETPASPRASDKGGDDGDDCKAGGITVEDLPKTIRKRLQEVLHEVEDASMREDSRLINFLGEVAEAQALAALNEYHSAVSETSVTIRNKPAYLMGILRKYKQGQRAALGNGTNGGVATTPGAMGRMGAGPNGLAPSISSRLEKLYESKFIRKDDVDQRCLDFFRDLPEKEAEAAMDEFAQSDIASIRNKSAFLMSILRKHHESSKKGGGGGVGMYGSGGGYSGSSMLGYGYMDSGMGGQTPFAAYGGRSPHLFNAYGQPMAAFIPPHMPMCPPGSMEVLPASIQLRLDHLAAIGFCQPSEIDDRCRKFLREVPEHVALQSIDEFMSVDRSYIRKVSAYFMGVIRKHAEQYRSGAGEGAGGGHSGVPPYEVGMKRIRDYNDNFMSKRPMGGGEVMERLAGAPRKVRAGVQDLLTRGVAVEWDIDVRVSNALLQLTEEQGVAAIEEFGSCDMSRIRNKSAYLMGLLKRYRTGAPPPPGLNRRE